MSRSRRKRRAKHRDEQPKDDDTLPDSKKMRKEATSKVIIHETSYYYRDGFRCVRPYYFTFTTHAKGRWLGKSVFEMFSKEFQSEKPEYYEKAITSGRVTVNGHGVQLSTIIRDNDLICHNVHRHEPPVTSLPIPILHEDSRLVVVNKPSSIPVHPCGRYRHNTIVYILCKEHNWSNLYTIHRLDRLTSGVLILAKSLEITQQLEHQIRERQLKKKYLCRIMGEFSDTPVECSQPIVVVSHKVGLCRVDQKGKPSSTLFTRLSYNGESSLLQCEPKTGRMHQIRIHLQWLGFPIIGDPVYNHPAWGPKRGQAGEGTEDMDAVMSAIVQSNYSDTVCEQSQTQSDFELQDKCIASANDGITVSDHIKDPDHTTKDKSLAQGKDSSLHPKECHLVAVDNSTDLVGTATEHNNPEQDKRSDQLDITAGTDPSFTTQGKSQDPDLARQGDPDCIKETKDPFCTECSLCRADPTPQQLLMCLHALSYTGPDWQFVAPPPPWAADDWVPP